MHDLVDTHETLRSPLPAALGSTVGATVQRKPSHDPMSGCFVGPSLDEPTAVHEVADKQETPSSSLSAPFTGLYRTDQYWPSHCRMYAPLEVETPTAVQAVGEVQDTLRSEPSTVSRLCWTDQVEPSHDMISESP